MLQIPRLTDYELLLENLRDLQAGKDIQASSALPLNTHMPSAATVQSKAAEHAL